MCSDKELHFLCKMQMQRLLVQVVAAMPASQQVTLIFIETGGRFLRATANRSDKLLNVVSVLDVIGMVGNGWTPFGVGNT